MRHTRATVEILTTVAIALTATAAFCATIANPSFELNSFTNEPGVISDNAPITGWTANEDTRVAPANGSITLASTRFSQRSFHLYGFSNDLVENAPAIGVQPPATSSRGAAPATCARLPPGRRWHTNGTGTALLCPARQTPC